MNMEILNQVEAKTLKPQQAYNQLFKDQTPVVPRLERASFIKFGITIPDSKGITLLLRTLFALPLPIVFARPFIKKAFSKQANQFTDLSSEDLFNLISVKGIRVLIKSNDGVRVKLKTM